MKLSLILPFTLLVGCSAASAVEPLAAPVAMTVVQAGDCYEKAHTLDAGLSEKQEVFDKCACEAGAGPEYCR